MAVRYESYQTAHTYGIPTQNRAPVASSASVSNATDLLQDALQWFRVAYSLLYVLPKLHRAARRYKACTARGDRESGFSRNGRFLYNPASERRLMIYYMGEELQQDERVSGEVLLA